MLVLVFPIDTDADDWEMLVPAEAIELGDQDWLTIKEERLGRSFLRKPNEVGPFGRSFIRYYPAQVDDRFN